MCLSVRARVCVCVCVCPCLTLGCFEQVYELSNQFLPKEWIMEKWEEGFYITAMAGSQSGSSLVVMSKGTPYTQQSYKVRAYWGNHGGDLCVSCRSQRLTKMMHSRLVTPKGCFAQDCAPHALRFNSPSCRTHCTFAWACISILQLLCCVALIPARCVDQQGGQEVSKL
jgi:hypothetical protein